MIRLVSSQVIHAVILAGGADFGRCLLAGRLPTALWPICERTAIDRLLDYLANNGISRASICFEGDASALQQAVAGQERDIEIRFLAETLPFGTAGCLREAAKVDSSDLFLVCQASMVEPAEIGELLAAQQRTGADMVVGLNPIDHNRQSENAAAGVYLLSRRVMEYIPAEGYCDIKEALIPALVRTSQKVHSVRLSTSVGAFRDWPGYLSAISEHLERSGRCDLPLLDESVYGRSVWASESAKVSAGVRIYGSVAILDGAEISADAVIFGPTVIGRDAKVGNGSLVESSVLWDRAAVGNHCQVRYCLVDSDAVVGNNSVLKDTVLPWPSGGISGDLISHFSSNLAPRFRNIFHKLGVSSTATASSSKEEFRNSFIFLFGLLATIMAFLWCYWPTLTDLWRVWLQSDEYSSGLLVPFLAIYIGWSRYKSAGSCPISFSVWGLVIFLVAQLIRHFGVYYMFLSAERLSFILSIGGLGLMLFGGLFFRRFFTVWLFLFLMLPLPNRVQSAITLPLQSWATSSAVFCLEVFGYEALRDGNVINIGDTAVAVAEACNGLRMLTAFFVISALVVLLVRRPLWEKLLLLASALPIALFCNTIRLVATAIALTVIEGQGWEMAFHDFGGLVMMPVALGLVVFELWFLGKIIILPFSPR